MAKETRPGSKKNPVITITGESLTKAIEKLNAPDYDVVKAQIMDGICDYDYKHISGINKGDIHHVDGSGIIMESLRKAFTALNIHLAFIDQHFDAELNIDDITEEMFENYDVHGFELHDKADSISVSIIGSKYVELGIINIKSPKILLDSFGRYKWYNELTEVVNTLKNEVALYKEGNFEAIIPKEKKPKKTRQMKLGEVDIETEAGIEDEKVEDDTVEWISEK